jgi:hypothetical protein
MSVAICLKGVISTTSLINGRPAINDTIIHAIEKMIAKRDVGSHSA